MKDTLILDEFSNYTYKELKEMYESPEYKSFIKLIRQGVKDGTITVYPPLPEEEGSDSLP